MNPKSDRKRSITLRSLLFLAWLPALALSIPAGAAVKTIKSLRVVMFEDGQLKSINLPIKDLKVRKKYNVVLPHPSLNPERKTESWEGVLVTDLVKKLTPNTKPSTPIAITATDLYSIELTMSQLKKTGAIIAIKTNGKPISMAGGGPQVVFPNTTHNHKNGFMNASWWCWFAHTIFIGKPPPIVELVSTNARKTVNLGKLKTEIYKTLLKYPIGRRPKDPKKKKIPLKILRAKTLTQDGFSVKTHLGSVVSIDKDYVKHAYFVLGTDKKPYLKPVLGGPVQLCFFKKERSCIHFIKEINGVFKE